MYLRPRSPLHSSEATRVIRRKSQHPDMWAVLMTRLHVHYWRSDPRRSPPLYYAKSERRPVQLSRWHIMVKVDRNQIEYDKWYIKPKPKQYNILWYIICTWYCYYNGRHRCDLYITITCNCLVFLARQWKCLYGYVHGK